MSALVINTPAVGDFAFAGSDLEAVVLRDSVREIGNYAFFDCPKLRRVDISPRTHIGVCAFKRCPGLSDKDGFTVVGGTLCDYRGEAAAVRVPEGVTAIVGGAFRRMIGETGGRAELCEIILPESVREIGYGAFSDCHSLLKIDLSDSVEEIGPGAFAECTSLVRARLPNGLRTIEEYAFWHCGALESVLLPPQLAVLGQRAFGGCVSLRQIVLPDSLLCAEKGAFDGCRELQSVSVPDGCAGVCAETFSDCAALIGFEVRGTQVLLPFPKGCDRLKRRVRELYDAILTDGGSPKAEKVAALLRELGGTEERYPFVMLALEHCGDLPESGRHTLVNWLREHSREILGIAVREPVRLKGMLSWLGPDEALTLEITEQARLNGSVQAVGVLLEYRDRQLGDRRKMTL